MKPTILFTAATLALMACDDPNHLEGASVEQTCPDPDVEDDPETSEPPGDSPEPEDDPVVPGEPLDSVHDIQVSIEPSDEGTDILVEFQVGDSGTGAIHMVHAPQTTIELVQDGQTIVAMEADLPHLRNVIQNGVTCGSVFEEGYQVVFADTEALAGMAADGTPLVHATAMQEAVATDPELAGLLTSTGVMPVSCEEECSAAGGITGSGIGAAGAAACCVGTSGLGCLPCAGGAGAAGAAIGFMLSAGCKGLFC